MDSRKYDSVSETFTIFGEVVAETEKAILFKPAPKIVQEASGGHCYKNNDYKQEWFPKKQVVNIDYGFKDEENPDNSELGFIIVKEWILSVKGIV